MKISGNKYYNLKQTASLLVAAKMEKKFVPI
jgi:hypothetical protein